MEYFSERESANSGNRGWSPKVRLVLRVSDKSFPVSIDAGVNLVHPFNCYRATSGAEVLIRTRKCQL